MPALQPLVRHILLGIIASRAAWNFFRRVFWAEPMMKAYCRKYGRNFHTGSFLHRVQGSGTIEVGDNVKIDGKSCFDFIMSSQPHPTIWIGSNVVIGHGCSFTVGKEIRVGSGVMIAEGCSLLDTDGHPTFADERLSQLFDPTDKFRPVVIEDRVRIGQGAIIMPGSYVGQGAEITPYSVIRGKVPPYTIWAGNPAEQVGVVPSRGALWLKGQGEPE